MIDRLDTRGRALRGFRNAVVAAGAAVLVLGVLAIALMRPSGPLQATRPCEQTYAESLGADPILATSVPGDIRKAIGLAGGYCEDVDGGGVSIVEQSRSSTSSYRAIVTYVADAARRQGWQDVRITGEGEMGSAYPGPGVCAHSVSDGHSRTLRLKFEDDATIPAGQISYTMSITGDEGNYPNC